MLSFNRNYLKYVQNTHFYALTAQSEAHRSEVADKMNKSIKIAIIDNHPLWRAGVSGYFKDSTSIKVVAEGAKATDALRLAKHIQPDLMLLDTEIEGGGINAAESISTNAPHIKPVILSDATDRNTVQSALQAGCRGYVSKTVEATHLARIIKSIYSGDIYLTPEIAISILFESIDAAEPNSDPHQMIDTLTRREQQILSHLVKGLSNKQIAGEVFLSEKTIKHYMTNILQKLQVRSRVEAALIAQRMNFSAQSSTAGFFANNSDNSPIRVN